MARRNKIAVIPGDGIGPEVTAEAVKVLKATHLNFEFQLCSIGGTSYLEKGTPLPPETLDILNEADAVLLGPVGHDYAPYEIHMKVSSYFRVEKDAYANLRPLKLYPGVHGPLKKRHPNGIDLVIVRENSEGLSLLRSGTLELARGTDSLVTTDFGAHRIIRFAYNYALKKGRRRVTCIDQSNWLFSDKLFRRVFNEIAGRYPSIHRDSKHVDVAAMMLVQHPESFDVIVTPDLYGDILSGVVIGLIGGIGMAPSVLIGDNFAFFETVHGTAQDIAGKGIANPIASILSAKLMLEWLREEEAARLIDVAVEEVLAEGKVRTPDLGGTSKTTEVGDAIAAKVTTMT